MSLHIPEVWKQRNHTYYGNVRFNSPDFRSFLADLVLIKLHPQNGLEVVDRMGFLESKSTEAI